MTCIVSWNIQNGKGVDGVVSLKRIARVIGDLCDPDVICLQEVSRGLRLSRGAGAPDQIAELAALFPGYQVIFGAAVDARSGGTGSRWQFGNATLTRLPLLSLFRHPLPQPASPEVRNMPRQATETTVAAPFGPLRVVNTHLEFHCSVQRAAQLGRLRYLQTNVAEAARRPSPKEPDGPYQLLHRPSDCVLCGDFNMEVGSEGYTGMLASTSEPGAQYLDAWPKAHRTRPHDPTCGIHDRTQWPQGPHCRDFFFVTAGLAERLEGLTVDTETDASDHQPLALSIAQP